ncbi:MAG: phenylalanine--tRNA ligase subunit beta [Pseudomonadales bacterium]|nr:phenylalanine--tRNA ligase subunit beta [Pseudomonadales bacterium]
MKFSEAWLREFVNADLSTEELLAQLTMIGVKVEGFEPVAAAFDKVVVGEIKSVEKHPDADKLVVCKVAGGETELQVVCGAPNARAGIKVPFALVGADLGDFKIKKAKLRGVESFGMLCSERELGISDRHEGLMELPVDAPVGEDIRKYLALDDVIVELDLTANRSDCLGMIGLGREAALIANADIQLPAVDPVPPTIEDVFGVELESSGCPRFVGRVIRNIDLRAQTPLWMKEKLRRSDIRSIDPVVDVTNYVMLELGQPMHAYDLAKLTGRIVVRDSKAGEKITLLDESEVTLKDDTLLITDDSGPIGMAGIMGGLGTSVTEGTRNIYLESAFFQPTAIAGRARTYGMNTDASHRFERGVDWAGQARAVERATRLLLEIAGGEPGPTVETVRQEALPVQPEVAVRASRVKRLLGVSIPDAEIDTMFSRLHFDTRREDGEDTIWRVVAPSHRFDIEIEADLIEEICRIYGYNTMPPNTPLTHLSMLPATEHAVTLDAMKDQLVARGYREAITYSFVDARAQAILDPENEPIGLANPLSSEMGVMRTTLWAGLLKSLIYNVNRQQSRVRLFESGLRFTQRPNVAELTMENIQQEKMLSGVACGALFEEGWANSTQAVDFFDVKGDIESLLALTGEPDSFRFEAGTHPALHPGQTARITRDGEHVGFVGLLDPRAQQALDIEHPVYLFELRVDAVAPREVPGASALSRFPEVRRDIAILVDVGVTAGEIRQTIRSAASETLTNLKLFDVYQGKGIDPNRKSLALGLTFQHPSRTLTEDEINQSVDRILGALASELGASLRG